VIAEQSGEAGSGQPLRVLWLIKGLGAGGAEQLLVQSARHRDRQRVAPAAAYLLSEKTTLVHSLEAEGVEPVRCLEARSAWDPRWLLRLRRWLRSERFDVVHIHSPLVAIGSRLVIRTLPRRDRPRIVVTEHNVWSSHKPLVRIADGVTAGPGEVHLAVSDAVLRSMPARLRKRARVVRYGVEAAEIRERRGERAAVRRELGFGADDVVIGTVANLRATKGYPDLLEAAVTVTSAEATARFVSIGRGPLEPDLRARHDRLGLGDRFQFLGFRPDAVRCMAGFDIFCLASHHEGLPIALMEALALGVPAVATRVGGVEEIVTDGQEALLVPAHRPDLLAAALLDLVRDEPRRASMAALALARGETLDAPSTVATIESVYREVVAR
jgi:glycosyltransferase involved in cell wall biosynthesis